MPSRFLAASAERNFSNTSRSFSRRFALSASSGGNVFVLSLHAVASAASASFNITSACFSNSNSMASAFAAVHV